MLKGTFENVNFSSMVFIYNTFIFLYVFLIRITAVFNRKASLWIKGRKDIFKKLQNAIPRDADIIWFHCASLGEFEQGRPVMEEVRKRNPGFKILLTFFSPSGYEIRKNYGGADFVFYLPADTKRNAKRWIEIVKPKIVVFIKYEFWFHYINELAKAKIPLYLISAKFRSNQIFFKWYGRWYAKMLKSFRYFFVQDKVSADLLSRAGIKNVSITGDTRFDRVYAISKTAGQIPIAQNFCKNNFIIVAGSTWPKDEAILAAYMNQAPENIKMIIAPHEIEEKKLENLSGLLRVYHAKFSKAGNSDLSNTRVLIIDNIGMLSSLYQYANISYIGGGFGKGIHNILEAATFGIPVVFGPNYYKFKEAADLINNGGAFSINNYKQFINLVDKLIINNDLLKTSGETSKKYVESGIGASNIIVDKILIF